MIRRILILTSSFLLVFTPLVQATNWCSHANVKACYLVETGSGQTLEDETENYDGSFKGDGEPAWESNVPAAYSDYSIDCDGTDDVVTSGDLDLDGNFTIVVWIYIEDWDGDDKRIIHKPGDIYYFQGNYYIMADPPQDDYEIKVGYRSLSGTYEQTASTGDSISTATWHHIAAVNTGSEMQLWIDGVDVASDNSLANTPQTNDCNLEIGGATSGSNEYVSADLDEIAIFSTDFDSTDINDIMDNGLVQAAASVPQIIFVNQ
jgi:hypothetical protein